MTAFKQILSAPPETLTIPEILQRAQQVEQPMWDYIERRDIPHTRPVHQNWENLHLMIGRLRDVVNGESRNGIPSSAAVLRTAVEFNIVSKAQSRSLSETFAAKASEIAGVELNPRKIAALQALLTKKDVFSPE